MGCKPEKQDLSLAEIGKEEAVDVSSIKEPMTGDIIFHESLSSQSAAIQAATKSRYSHVGMIVIKEGVPYVFEAISKTSYTPLKDWVERGKDYHFVLKRYKERLLTKEEKIALVKYAEKWEGTDYDLYFEWSDEQVYCSELVWKVYKEVLGVELGTTATVASFDLESTVVKNKMKERYGENIPLNEIVISPSAVFYSDELVDVPLK